MGFLSFTATPYMAGSVIPAKAMVNIADKEYVFNFGFLFLKRRQKLRLPSQSLSQRLREPGNQILAWQYYES